jgi:hypothetical protein
MPSRDEFAVYCVEFRKRYPDIPLPVIDSTPESFIEGGTFNDMTYSLEFRSKTEPLKTRLQDVVPWRKLMLAVETERTSPNPLPVPRVVDLKKSLLIAAMVVECDKFESNSYIPTEKNILHCSNDLTIFSDNDLAAVHLGRFYKMAVWTSYGLLCIRRGPRGFYFDLIASIPSEADEYPPRRTALPGRPRRHSLCGYLGANYRDKVIREKRLAGWQGLGVQVDVIGQEQDRGGSDIYLPD